MLSTRPPPHQSHQISPHSLVSQNSDAEPHSARQNNSSMHMKSSTYLHQAQAIVVLTILSVVNRYLPVLACHRYVSRIAADRDEVVGFEVVGFGAVCVFETAKMPNPRVQMRNAKCWVPPASKHAKRFHNALLKSCNSQSVAAARIMLSFHHFKLNRNVSLRKVHSLSN